MCNGNTWHGRHGKWQQGLETKEKRVEIHHTPHEPYSDTPSVGNVYTSQETSLGNVREYNKLFKEIKLLSYLQLYPSRKEHKKLSKFRHGVNPYSDTKYTCLYGYWGFIKMKRKIKYFSQRHYLNTNQCIQILVILLTKMIKT
jgi:hypothetical protein